MADGMTAERSGRAGEEHVIDFAPPAESPHSHRFRAAIAMLVGIAIGAIVIALVALAGGRGNSFTGTWSSWSPTDGGLQGAREIADHVAPLYRISGVDQLAVVTVANLASPSTSGASASSSGSSSSGGLEVAVRQDPNSSSVSLIGGNTVAYNLCGLGSANCAIGVGAPSADRLLLLRREALELALYTFRYIPGTQNVVAILPPGHEKTQATASLTAKPPGTNASAKTKPLDIALLFLHDELAPLLNQPLGQTLQQFPPAVPQVSLWKQTAEAALVAQITSRGMFSEHITTAQDGSNLIVLDPLPPS